MMDCTQNRIRCFILAIILLSIIILFGSFADATGDWPWLPNSGIHIFQAIDSTVNIRSGAGLVFEKTGVLLEDQTFKANLNESTYIDADGYKWVERIGGGFVAMGNINTGILLVNVVSEDTFEGRIGNTNISQHSIDIANLPVLFDRLPIQIGRVEWVQYFGNTTYAFDHGHTWGYQNYSQGLHGGLDLGNWKTEHLVYAGVTGKLVHRNGDSVQIRSGDYVIIYEHLDNTAGFQALGDISPNTIIGTLDISSNRLRHVHIEVRYKDSADNTWILNPLQLIPQELIEQVVNKFNPLTGNYFYQSVTWDKWTDIFEQPVLQLGGRVIGPRGRLRE